MDCSRNQFFARSAFTFDQNYGICESNLRNRILHLLYKPRRSDEFSNGQRLRQPRSEGRHFGLQVPAFDNAFEQVLQRNPVEWFDEVIVRSKAERLNCGVHFGKAGHHDSVDFGVAPLDGFQYFDTRHVPQVDIEQSSIKYAGFQKSESCAATRGGLALVASVGQPVLQESSDLLVVLNEQDPERIHKRILSDCSGDCQSWQNSVSPDTADA